MEGLLAPRTRLNVSSISITRTVVLIPGLFFDLYWSRTSVFCCTSSVYTGITQNKLPYLIVAPWKGCGSSPRTEVLGLGEVIECTSLVPGICCSRIPYHKFIISLNLRVITHLSCSGLPVAISWFQRRKYDTCGTENIPLEMAGE